MQIFLILSIPKSKIFSTKILVLDGEVADQWSSREVRDPVVYKSSALIIYFPDISGVVLTTYGSLSPCDRRHF